MATDVHVDMVSSATMFHLTGYTFDCADCDNLFLSWMVCGIEDKINDS